MAHVADVGWQNAFNVMKDNYSLTDDAIGVFAINLRFNLDDIQTIVSESITGGGDDKNAMYFTSTKNERSQSLLSAIYREELERQHLRIRHLISTQRLLGYFRQISILFLMLSRDELMNCAPPS